MLTVAKITAQGAAGYGDYLQGKTQTSQLGDYYLKDGERVEAPGRWVRMSAALGVSDGNPRVSTEALRALMAVQHPGTGEPLRPIGGNGQAVAAIDATFSAPKSVSVVWALGDEELRHRIEVAHERAINRAVAYAIAQVPMARRRISEDTVIHVKAKDVVATSWRHTTARSVDGQPPDPQLHSHVLLHAAVREDGRIVAIDSRAWMTHQREIGAAYRSELAHEMAQLGYGIRRGTGRGGRYFEIEGVPQALLDLWSSRGRQIEAAIQHRMQAKGIAAGTSRWEVMSAGEDRRLRLSTRAAKEPVTAEDLDLAWRGSAQSVGVGGQALERQRTQRPRAYVPVPTAELVSALTEFDATFSDREARAVALERSAGTDIASSLEILTQARREGEILALADSTFTTRQHRAMEEAVLGVAREVIEETGTPVAPQTVEGARDQINGRLAENGGALSPEQEEALLLGTGGRRLAMIEGQAGTGKSTVLQAVALAHQADGREVIVTSTGALAAQRLAADLSEAGVDAAAYSTAALEQALICGDRELTDRTTIIHDEAALASTREQRALIGAIRDSGARLILIGDPEQSQPVGAGGLWTHLRAEVGEEGRVELSTNLRAQDPADRRDQQLFRHHQHEAALQGYASRERLWIGEDQHEAEDVALLLAYADHQAGKRTLVIAQTSNDHLDELNARAQADRALGGELGPIGLPVPGRPYRIHAGDEVQIRRSIQAGDRRLANGTEADVAEVSRDGEQIRLRLADQSLITLSREQIIDADLRLAYVQHPFPAQGVTVDTAHLIVGQHSTRDGSYVALTRAREQTHIHAAKTLLDGDPDRPPLASLGEAMGRQQPEVPAIEKPLAHEQNIERQLDHDAAKVTRAHLEAPEVTQGPFAQRAAERAARSEITALAGAERSAGWEP